MTFVLASQNKKKIKELNEILSEMGITVVSASEAGFTEDVEETGTTFIENALIKARAVSKALGKPAIADDSGLVVEALYGAPGVYSARYADEIPNATDDDRNNKLLSAMVEKTDRKAYFACAIACVLPDGEEIITEGKCEGVITREKSGDGGFGYDPIFYVEQFGKTFGELEASQKNEISHRGKALKELKIKLKEKI